MVSVIKVPFLMVSECILMKLFCLNLKKKNGVNVVFLSERMSGNHGLDRVGNIMTWLNYPSEYT